MLDFEILGIVCKHNNFRKNYWIGLHFCTLLEVPNRKEISHFRPTVLVSSIKNVFLKIKKSIFPPKYTEYGKNVMKQNCLFQIDLQIYWCPFFHKRYVFYLLTKNGI